MSAERRVRRPQDPLFAPRITRAMMNQRTHNLLIEHANLASWLPGRLLLPLIGPAQSV
jgi:hypothetical protein